MDSLSLDALSRCFSFTEWPPVWSLCDFIQQVAPFLRGRSISCHMQLWNLRTMVGKPRLTTIRVCAGPLVFIILVQSPVTAYVTLQRLEPCSFTVEGASTCSESCSWFGEDAPVKFGWCTPLNIYFSAGWYTVSVGYNELVTIREGEDFEALMSFLDLLVPEDSSGFHSLYLEASTGTVNLSAFRHGASRLYIGLECWDEASPLLVLAPSTVKEIRMQAASDEVAKESPDFAENNARVAVSIRGKGEYLVGYEERRFV